MNEETITRREETISKVHAIIYLTNLLLVILIVIRVQAIDNDKAHIIFIFFYPLVIGANFLVGTVLKRMGRKLYVIFYGVCAWMAAGFLPLLAVMVQ